MLEIGSVELVPFEDCLIGGGRLRIGTSGRAASTILQRQGKTPYRTLLDESDLTHSLETYQGSVAGRA